VYYYENESLSTWNSGTDEINVGCGKVTEDQRFGHGSDSNIIVPWAATVTPTSGDKDDKPFAAKIVSPSLILTSSIFLNLTAKC